MAEEGGYVAHRFLGLAACLKLDPLPRSVCALLAGSSEATGWDANERLVAQVGAIEAARGAGTREAFDALLAYQQLGEGVLLSVVEALAETASILIKGGDLTPLEQLLSIAESSPREDSRGAAAATVATLIKAGTLTPPKRRERLVFSSFRQPTRTRAPKYFSPSPVSPNRACRLPPSSMREAS